MIGLNFNLQELLKKFEEVFSDWLVDCLIVEEWIRVPKVTQVLNATGNRCPPGCWSNIIDR